MDNSRYHLATSENNWNWPLVIVAQCHPGNCTMMHHAHHVDHIITSTRFCASWLFLLNAQSFMCEDMILTLNVLELCYAPTLTLPCFTQIQKCGRRCCLVYWSQQLSIGQDHLNTVDRGIQLLGNFFVNIRSKVRAPCCKGQHLMPRKTWACQHEHTSFTNKIQLQNTDGIIDTWSVMADVATAGRCKSKEVTPRFQRRNVTLSIVIASTSHISAMTSEKHCMQTTCRHVCVWDAFIQTRNVTFSKEIASRSHSSAITSEKHCMGTTCRNLGVWDAFIQKRNVALSIVIASTSHSSAMTSEKHCMQTTCRHVCVWDAFIQTRNVTLSIIVVSTSHSSAITSEKHCMFKPYRNLGVWDAFIQKRNVTLS